MTQSSVIKRKKLEIILSGIKWPAAVTPTLEQYMTPADIAANIVFSAYSHGNIYGRSVVDLGTGTGIFAIAAAIVGAEIATGIDIDRDMCAMARENASRILENDAKCEFLVGDVRHMPLKKRFDTCIMNPPFGAQKRHSDRVFMEAAVAIAGEIYSLHNAVTCDFVLDYYRRLGATAGVLEKYIFPIPYMFPFHKKENVYIETVLIHATTEER